MSSGSLRDLSKTLGTLLSAPPVYPPPENVVNDIQEYLNKQEEADEQETTRLHEELLHLHASKVAPHPDKLSVFLAVFRQLRPAITKPEHLTKWWDILVKPTMDSMGQAKAVVSDARAIILSVLAYEEDDDTTGEKKEAAEVFATRLFEIFLARSKAGTARAVGLKQEQQQRFVSQNVEAVLLSWGKRRPKAFLEKIDSFVVQKETRLQILGLLCSYVRLQGPHLYVVIDTPLFDHLLQCLENDTSTTVISLALTILIMFMPHLCNSLAAFLPRLFVIYTRVLCWDKFGVVRLGLDMGLPDTWTGSPLSSERPDGEPAATPVWQKLDSSFESATSTTPDVSDYFTFLYGLYPINFLSFIRSPYRFLETVDFKGIDQLDIEEDVIRQRTEPYRQRHLLHPNFLNLTAETELKDQNRWMKVEPADVTAGCIGLVNNPLSASRERDRPVSMQVLPDELLPTEDIPPESLLAQEEGASVADDQSIAPSIKTTGSDRDRSPDSPTLPPTLGHDAVEESRLQDMLNLQEQLHASLHESLRLDNPAPPPQTSLPQPPAGPPPYSATASANPSPRLDSYVHHLNHNTLPRSPALRPAASDTQGTIAYLQREVMLLKNDLNFERYLKQQHLQHIGHLQRKHIKESTAEAETQNLINTNKSLKAKLEEAKKAYVSSKQEALKAKNTAKKWEAELSAKIRTLREEQKAWRADEEATKKSLQSAKQEADSLRKLLSDTEAEGLRARQQLQDLMSEMEEANKLRKLAEHLRTKLAEYEARDEEFEIQKQREERALAEVQVIKMKMEAREKELDHIKDKYEEQMKALEDKLAAANRNPAPREPGPGLQKILDQALAKANSQLESLKKKHMALVQKNTDLELKFMELQAEHEMGSMGMHSTYGPGSLERSMSDNDLGHATLSHQARAMPRNYQRSENSTSPVSSYAESSGSHGQYAAGMHTGYHTQGHSPPHSSGTLTPYSPGSRTIREEDYLVPGQRHLQHRPSMPDSFHTTSGMSTESGGSGYMSTLPSRSISDDGLSLRTVTSATSSEQRRAMEKAKSGSESRIRGRGGVQNIGKKDKKEKMVENEYGEMVPKQKKKSRFTPGSGLAGIRGFV